MQFTGVPRRLRRRVRGDPALAAVLALAALALAARLVFLGDRVAHFDEGRVAYWTLRYHETGAISYRHVVHGPLVQHVDAHLFGLFGTSDAVSRLPVAVFGGLLPLAALLLRDRLDDDEVVALAGFLALNPVLLYYSRFLRSTLLVAGLAFVAFCLLVRAVDGRGVGYVYAAAVALALAFAAKENAAVYVVTWAGAVLLLSDPVLFGPRSSETAGFDFGGGRVGPWPPDEFLESVRARAYAGHAVGALAVFALVALFFYAPRDPGGVGLWSAVGNPTTLPALLDATLEDVVAGYDYWFGQSSEPGCHTDSLAAAYVCFLGQFLGTLLTAATALTLLAVGGFLVARYVDPRPRPLVAFASYWGFASVLGYPLGTDIYGAWITVNAIVPLAVPAAVGVAALYRQGRRSLRAGDRVAPALLALALVLVAAQTGLTVATAVYADPAGSDNELVQYAQPSDDVRPAIERLEPSDGPDMVVYGEALTNDGIRGPIPPACADYRDLLPLQWYFERRGLSATCAADPAALDRVLADGWPQLVVARDANESALATRLDGYESRSYDLRAGDDAVTFYVRDGA